MANKLQSSNSPVEHERIEGREGTPMRPQRAGDKLPEASVSEKRTTLLYFAVLNAHQTYGAARRYYKGD